MISEIIKTLRNGCRWTQDDLAKKLGVTRSSVNAWEMGLSVPSTQYIAELANLFKVSSDYLLGLDANFTLNITDLSEDEKLIVINLVNYFLNKDSIIQQ